MVAERVFVVKGLPADAAVELLVVAVTLFVKLERVRRAEALQADLATERLHQRLVSPPCLERSLLSALGFFAPVGVHVLLVDQEAAVEEEGLPAEVAHERFAGAVDEHVRLELGVVREALATFLAGEGLLARVDAKVPLEVVVEAEPGAADVAGERFLPRVHEAVPLQSRSRSVRPVAHVADKRRDARVLPLVHRQRVGVLEGLLAHGALVLFGVGVDHLVEAQGVFALEVLAARGTAEGPLLRVHRHVTFEVDGRLERLVAHRALEHFLLLLVAQEVVFQRRLDAECLPALVAGEGLRRLGALMELQVILEGVFFPIRPLTMRTWEWQG